MRSAEEIYDWKLDLVAWNIDVSTVSFAVRHLYFSFLVVLYVCRFMPAYYAMAHPQYFAYLLYAYAGLSLFIWLGLVQYKERPQAYHIERIGRVYRPLQYLNHWVLPYPLGYPNSRRIWKFHASMVLSLLFPYLGGRWAAWRARPIDIATDVAVITVLVAAVAISWFLAVTHFRERQEEQSQ
jgi:hypothetical protein